MEKNRIFIIRREVYDKNMKLEYVENIDACRDPNEAARRCTERKTGNLQVQYTFDTVLLD